MDAQLAQQARLELEDVFAAASKQASEPTQENPEGEGRPSKWRKDDSKQGKGPSYGSWDSQWSGSQRPKRHWKDDAQQESGSGEDKQTQELLKCLVKMTVRHEQELMRIRPDVGFIAFVDTSSLGCVELLQGVLKAWQAQFEAGTVKTALKTILALSMMKDLKERAEAILRDEEKLQRCLTVGWAVETETGLNPAWIYQTWDSKEKKQVRSEAPPLKHTEAFLLGGRSPGKPPEGGGPHPLLVPQATTGDLYGGGDPRDSAAELARRGQRRLPQSSEAAERQRLHEAPGGPLEARADSEATPGSSSRGGILKYAVLRLESAGQPDPLATQGDLGRSSAAAALEGARPLATPAMQAPALFNTRMVNRTNVCYINATLQVLVWLVEFSGACLGRLQAVSGILRAGRGIHLPDCFALRGLFSTWAMLHQQHDAGEFLHHSLEFAQAEAWHGHWEARLSNPAVVHDTGTLHQAILLHMRGASLQELLDAWSSQFAVHAIAQHHGLIFLQLGRYANHHAKIRDTLRVRPGDSVAVPIFAEHSCTSLRHETFTVVALVYHLGETVTSGHYLALLGLPRATGWDYLVCDDNKTPRKARAVDLDLVDSNCYLLGLMRTP